MAGSAAFGLIGSLRRARRSAAHGPFSFGFFLRADAMNAARAWLTPHRLMAVSIAVALLTLGAKTAAWRLTGSVGLLSDALESLVNLAGATFGLWMVTVAARPADADHPFGHDKAEYFSAGFEGILIIAAALAIIWAALPRFWRPHALEQLGWGVALAVASAGLNGALGWIMLRASRQHHSMALEGDARHLITDVWTSVGVVAGIVGVAATGWLWLDPTVAILMALNILYEGSRLIWRSSQGLMDAAVEPELQQHVAGLLAQFAAAQGAGQALRIDHVMSRRAGQRLFVSVHLHLPPDWSLGRAAALRSALEQTLLRAQPQLDISIQLLPLDAEPAGTSAPASPIHP